MTTLQRMLAIASVVAMALPLLAQEGTASEPENRFLLSGYGFTTYTDVDEPGHNDSFSAGFAPIFLYRVSDKFLFEAELEFEFSEGGEVETEIEYAQIDFLATDHLTVVFGKYLTPFGQFIERLHPAWINKLPTAPLPYRHGESMVPFAQTGLQLRGGVPIGPYRRFTYAAFVSNGFEVAEHHGEEELHGDEESPVDVFAKQEDDHHEELIFFADSGTNSNGDEAWGGRLGLLPGAGLDFGASWMSGTYDEDGLLDVDLFGIDLSYHHELFDLKAEWLDSDTELPVDPITNEGGGAQEVEAWYLQPSVRLSFIPSLFFNRLELVTRFAELDAGHDKIEQMSFGFNYYFTGSSIFRVAWEEVEEGAVAEDSLNFMFALGF